MYLKYFCSIFSIITILLLTNFDNKYRLVLFLLYISLFSINLSLLTNIIGTNYRNDDCCNSYKKRTKQCYQIFVLQKILHYIFHTTSFYIFHNRTQTYITLIQSIPTILQKDTPISFVSIQPLWQYNSIPSVYWGYRVF